MRVRKVYYLLLAALFGALLAGPALAGTTGIISGVVTDADSGGRLSGVNVVVEGTDLATVTDSNGYFVVTNVPPGAHRVAVDLVGYKPALQQDVQVTMDFTSTVNFVLEHAVVEEQEATVTVSRKLVRPDVTPTLYIIDSKQEKWTKKHPDNLYQVPGIVLSQPGVTADYEGRPHIRGGRNDQVGYMLEGIPITQPTTNGFGTNTVTVGLSKMQIYTGGYRAEYGNAISGIFNEVKKTGSESPGWSVELTGGGQDFKGSYLEMGGVSANGLDYYVGSYLWRTNYEKTLFVKGETADTIGKFVYAPTEQDRLTLLLNHGVAKGTMAGVHTITNNSAAVVPEEDHSHQGYRIAGLTWARNFTPASFITVRPYMFDSYNTVDALSPQNNVYFEVESKQRGLQVEYTNQATQQHLVKVGGSVIGSSNKYYGFIPNLNMYFNPEWGPYQYTSSVDTTQLGLYLQDQWKVADKWMFEMGLRYDGMTFDKAVSPDTSDGAWSPRLGLTFSPTPKGAWRASWGKFIQFPPTYMMDRVYTDPNWENYREGNSEVNSERSWSFDLGYEHQLSDTLLGRITPFYRKYEDLLQTRRINPAQAFPTVYYNAGAGTSKGVECYLNRKFTNSWDGWLSYTYMKSVANASSIGAITPGVFIPVDWDQRHTIQAAMNFKRGTWDHSLQMQYGSGLPYSGPGDVLANQRRVDGHVVFSLNTTKKLPKNSWLGDEIYLNLYNIFDSSAETHRKVTYDSSWNPVGSEPDYWVKPRFMTIGIVRRF